MSYAGGHCAVNTAVNTTVNHRRHGAQEAADKGGCKERQGPGSRSQGSRNGRDGAAAGGKLRKHWAVDEEERLLEGPCVCVCVHR